MTEAEVLKKLTVVFHDVFDDESIELSSEMTANDIEGWDSQTHVMLTVAAEQCFGIKFRTAELESLRNVGHFAEVISRKLETR